MGLTIDIGARITGFMSQMGLVRKQLQQFGSGFGAGGMLSNLVGIGGITMALGAFKGLAASMDDVAANARNLNMSVGEFQKLKIAAELADLSVESLAGGVKQMRKFLADIGMTGKSSGELEAIGLSFEKLKGMNPGEQLMAIGNALNAMTDATVKDYVAAQILGKNWQDVLGAMSELPAAMEQAKKASIIDDETVKNLAAANDQLALMKANLAALAASVVGGDAGILGAMNQALQLQNQYLKENREIWSSWLAGQNVDLAKTPLIAGIGNGVVSGITNGVFPPKQ